MGFSNASMVFIDMINKVFRKFIEMFLIMLIDDILIYSRSESEHVDHLIIVFQVLKDHQNFAK